ncbi:MAG: hypothetical protein ACLUA4_09765 [Bifidobacterium sp.]
MDSKGSFANRVEETITEARRTGEGLLASMPHVSLSSMMTNLVARLIAIANFLIVVSMVTFA